MQGRINFIETDEEISAKMTRRECIALPFFVVSWIGSNNPISSVRTWIVPNKDAHAEVRSGAGVI